MGRAKNKKANNPPAVATLQQQPPVVLETPALEAVPVEESIGQEDTVIIASLQPYLSLLPALRGVGQGTQRALHESLYAAGSTAAQALESYLKDKSVVLKQLEGSENVETSSESEELRLLLNYVSVELAADNLRRACMGQDGKILLRDTDNKILNEVAAAALSAFAYAASRRPSTKHVEYLMNPTASVDAPDDTGSQSSQTLSALNDPKLHPPGHLLSGPPYQRCSNASVGTNGSSGVGNPFGIIKPRRRSANRRLNEEELLSDEENELDEDDVSDVELDEDSDLMDESRRTESPLDDFDNTDALLRFACTVGHVEIVKSLVRIRGSADYFCIRKSTMLMEACCAGQLAVVKELLAAGADINAESESRNTPLIYSSTAGKLECVQELLKHTNIVVDARNTSGHTALMEASSAGHLEIVKELLAHGANIYAIVENVDFKESSLSLASYRGHVDIVKCLLENMQDCPEKVDELHTGLLEAAMDGHVEVARVLLDGGALVNLPTENFESPLTLAACGGHYELVKLLLDRNADIEEPNDESYTPLMEAAREGHRDVVELLLDRGANVNSKIEEGIETPLTLAASGGYLSVVELLVSRGGNLLLGERSSLYEATQEGHADVADFIVKQLKKSEDPQVVLEDLNCALVCAAETNNMPLVNLFLENGANKDCYSKDGRTPLMESARSGHVNMLEFLLQCGADINKISPNHDATALSLACLFGHSDATQFLLENGANPEVSLKDSVSCIIEASRNGNTDCARIVLDHIGLKGKQKAQENVPSSQQMPPTSTASEISNRPKIKPVSKLNKDPANTLQYSNQQIVPQPPNFPPINGDALAQEFALFGHKISPELVAAAASMKASLPANGEFIGTASNTIEAKKAVAAMNSSISKMIVQQQQQQANEDTKLNELLQQLPGDLVNAMLAATATSNAANSTTTTADESMLAHFLQRALVEPKRRDAAWTNEELSAFKEMVRQKVRQLPAANVTPNVIATDIASQQHQDLMMANMLSECPGCAYNHPAYPTPNATHNLQYQDVPAIQNNTLTPGAPASLKRKGAAVKPRAGSVSTDCAGSFGSRQVNSVKQKLAETSELLRSKLDAISLSSEADETLQELRKLSAVQKQMGPVQNNSSVIQTSMYLNRMTSSTSNTVLTNDQQQQILMYQQKEIENLQNLQTAAGHHHVGSITTGSHAGSNTCHQVHHGAQMGCLHGTGRMARRTGQAIGSTNAAKQLCSGKHADRRSTPNASLSAPPPNIADQKVSSYVDMQTEANNDTALTVACVGGHSSLVGLLIQRGANVEHRDKKGFTPLILAATGGHIECCKLLLDANCQVDAVSERTKDTALSLSASSGRKEVVELLLRFNANKEHRNVSDYTPLSLAASGGYTDIIRLLLDAGAEINSRTGSKLGISPIMLASMNGHDQATLLLLERGSDINAQIETNRNTALTLACFQGRTEVVRLLLDYGANYEWRAKTGLTPLSESANGGYVEVGSLLLKAGADPNAPPVPTSRDTPLTIAADKGHSAFVSMLLIQGAAIDVKNKKGCTPLFLACANGHLETVKILVANHADVDSLDNRKISPLVAAFRKGFVKVVEFMVQHVNQFPNDQECQRFYNNLQDPDLAAKVKSCMTVIVGAKAKQAEQADLIADLLLEQLKEEEALAESKKLSKKRLKEKKKAKKLAKKQLESADDQNEEALPASPEPVEEIPEEPKPQTPPPVIQTKVEPTTKQKKQKKGVAKETPVFTQNNVIVPKEETPELPEVVEETRVPVVHDLPSSTQENGSSTLNQNSQNNHAKQATNQRRQNRGRRSEQTGNGTRISIHPNSNTILSPQHSPNVAIAPSAKSTNDDSEWCSAGKKRASSRPGKESSTTSVNTNSSGSRDVYHDLVTLMNDNLHVTDAWTLTEPVGKRRAFALNVNGGTVARIIGRAGQNINAIREATSAHIEVEKIATRREQSTRQITVKGTQEAVRSAVYMIDLLIRENDTLVSDIIQRVMNSEGSPINSGPVILPSVNTLDKTIRSSNNQQSNFSSFNTSTNQQATNNRNSQPTSNANVWQQRAAFRKLQQSTDEPTIGTFTNQAFSAQRPPSSSFSGSTSASISPVPIAPFNNVPLTNASVLATTTLAQHDFSFAHNNASVLNEDLKRKAPGFERPSGSAQGTPIKPPEIARPEEISMLFSNAAPTSENSFAPPSQLVNPYLSSIMNDNQQPSNFSDLPTVAPISHLAVGSQRNNTTNNVFVNQQQRAQRPLSEIWESNSSNSNTQQQPLGDFSELYTSGVIDPKSAAALWSPHVKNDVKDTTTVTSSNNLTTRDDHWLDSNSSTALFSSLGLNDFNSTTTANSFNTQKPINAASVIGSGLIGNRPHSSTDWTNVSSAWSNSAQPSRPNPINAQWAASSTTPNPIVSPPKTTASTWSSGPMPNQETYRQSRPIHSQNMTVNSRQAPIGHQPVSSGNQANWNNINRMDVFSVIAEQLGNVAEKEKKQQPAPSAASISNVYAAYNAPIQQVMQSRAAQNPTPPNVPFGSNVTWSGQPNLLNNNPNPTVFNNKQFPLNQSQPHQTQQQWNAWNY